MIVTIDDAIHAMALLRDEVNENGFLHECYNLSISALQTIKDGNYVIEDAEMEQMIKKIASFDCAVKGVNCEECIYYRKGLKHHSCVSVTCESLTRSMRKEIELWVREHWNELKTL